MLHKQFIKHAFVNSEITVCFELFIINVPLIRDGYYKVLSLNPN